MHRTTRRAERHRKRLPVASVHLTQVQPPSYRIGYRLTGTLLAAVDITRAFVRSVFLPPRPMVREQDWVLVLGCRDS